MRKEASSVASACTTLTDGPLGELLCGCQTFDGERAGEGQRECAVRAGRGCPDERSGVPRGEALHCGWRG